MSLHHLTLLIGLLTVSFSNCCLIPGSADVQCECDPLNPTSAVTTCTITGSIITLPSFEEDEEGKIHAVVFKGGRIQRLETGTLSGLQISQLTFQNVNLIQVEDGAFSSLGNNLLSLTIENAGLDSIPNGMFSGLSRLIVLNITAGTLTRLQDGDFRGLGSVKDLILDGNSISNIPARAFLGLEQLISLKIYNNEIRTIDADALEGLLELASLTLNGNPLATLPGSLFSHTRKLAQLSISDSGLSELPGSLFTSTPNLIYLYLSGNPLLREIRSDAFLGLTNLKTMLLQKNNISTLSRDAFRDLRSLDALFLQFNPIRRIERELLRPCVSLKILEAVSCQLEYIHEDALEMNEQLLSLNMGNNNLQRIPPGLFRNSLFISVISLQFNEIDLDSTSANTFENLQQLRSVFLDNNVITSVPRGFLAGANILEQISFRNNRIGNIESGAFDDLRRTGIVSLSSNNLQQLPASLVRQMSMLVSLDMSFNNLVSIPDDFFSGNPLLRSLNLRGNSLQSWPNNALNDKTHLSDLNLASNRISNLGQSSLWGLESIQNIDLRGNALTSVSNQIFAVGNFSSLSIIDFSRNSIQQIEAGALTPIKGSFFANFSNNRISTLHENFLGGDDGYRTYDFSFNAIACTSEGLKYLVENKFAVFYLTGNPVECNCSSAWWRDAASSCLNIISPPGQCIIGDAPECSNIPGTTLLDYQSGASCPETPAMDRYCGRSALVFSTTRRPFSGTTTTLSTGTTTPSESSATKALPANSAVLFLALLFLLRQVIDN